jgi:hypothetical protein
MLRKLLYFIFAANLLDTVLTDVALRTGHVRELNPFMDALYHHGNVWFYSVKIALSLAMLVVVPKAARFFVVRGLFTLTALVYSGALVMHSLWIVNYIRAL